MASPTQPTRAVRSGPTRVALVGTGFIAEFHLEILKGTPWVELVAACDADLDKARSAQRRYGLAHAVATLSELPALGVELVHLLVPPALHARLTREALELGLSVFVEKPLALSSAQARELGALARARGLVLAVNHNAVHHPSFVRLLQEVHSGRIGKLEHVRITLSVPLRQLDAGDVSHWMFREERNIVFEQGPHPFAQLHALLGKHLNSTSVQLATRDLLPGQRFHDKWLVAGRGERGTAEVYLSFGRSFTRSTIEVLGSDGSFEADLFHDQVSGEWKTPWLDFWNSYLAGARRGRLLRQSARRVLGDYLKQTLGLGARQDAFYAGMRGSIRAFHAALQSGAPLPADAECGAQVLEWCEAAVHELDRSQAGQLSSRLALPEPGPARPGEVLLIGATGFIGKPTLKALLARGLPVTVIARRAHALPVELEAAVRDGRVRFFQGSLEKSADLERALSGTRCVLQLAHGNGPRWEDVQRAMIDGTRTLAEAALAAKVERFVFVSSTAALYLGRDCGAEPFEDDVPADPRPELRPNYARGKIMTERALLELHRERGLPLVIARPGVVLGPGTPLQHSGIGLWARDNHCVGWGLGKRPLPLVLAEDVADALAELARYPGQDLDGKALNLCARVPLNAQQLVAAMQRISGRDLHFHARRLELSQLAEIGKWIVKRVGGRNDATFPSWRDLKSRELWPTFSARTAREKLGWKPVEDASEFLRRGICPP